MGNLPKIKKFSENFHLLISFFLVAIPLYYVVYWAFINYLPAKLIAINIPSIPLIPHKLPIKLQLVGFMTSLLPLSALIYGLVNIRKLFSFYKEGIIFSFEHVSFFKKTANALVLWVFSSMIYESAKSVLFSVGNPPGSRVIDVNFGTAEITPLLVGGIVFVIAWVMDEGRVLSEENELTI
ncbi:MAG: DUF2975 domain-containing protein [Pseudomonadota bacterium]